MVQDRDQFDAGRPGVLFDVDGTLIDSNYLHTLAWARAFADHGESAPMNSIHRLVGQGGDQLVTRLLGHDDDRIRQSRTGRYRELQGELVAYPGAVDLIRAVRDLGLAVVLATSSPSDELEQARKLLDCDDSIDAVTTADDVSSSIPAPDIFQAAIQIGRLDPRRTLVVGDSVWDVEAAAGANLGCLAVETGGFSHHELTEAGAMHVYRDVGQLYSWLRTSAIALLA